MTRSRNADAWALVCRLFSCEGPVLETSLSDAERSMLSVLADLKAVKRQGVDMRFMLCPYCQLLRGQVVQDGGKLVCQCPDCGSVSVDQSDKQAWVFDTDWLIRKLRGALDIPAQQTAVPITSHIWRIGHHQRRPVILARTLDLALRHPAALSRAGTRGASPPWLITLKPLRDVESDPCNGSAVWLPLEERFTLYGGNVQFMEPGQAPPSDEEHNYAVHGPFSEDFRWVHVPDWPHGPIGLTPAQAAVFQALWNFQGQAQDGYRVMAKAGLTSDKPGDVFKVKSKNKGDPKYEGPLFAYKALVVSERRTGSYAMLMASP
jgi:hypothetical protein